MEIGTDSALAISPRKTTGNLDRAVEDRNSSELYVYVYVHMYMYMHVYMYI